MQFYHPDRPRTASGSPAILTDGSALPHLSFIPIRQDTVRLMVMLPDYEGRKDFLYSYRHIDVVAHKAGNFLADYLEDPEVFFASHFGFVPQPRGGKRSDPPSFNRLLRIPEEQKAELDASLDLLG